MSRMTTILARCRALAQAGVIAGLMLAAAPAPAQEGYAGCPDGSCHGLQSVPYNGGYEREGVFSRFINGCKEKCGYGQSDKPVSAGKFSKNKKTCLTVCPPYCSPTFGFHETCWNKFPPTAPCYRIDDPGTPNWSSPTPQMDGLPPQASPLVPPPAPGTTAPGYEP